MSEWWTYHLSDFLLFSRSTYYRLFEIYNAAIWPAQVVAVALGLVILALLGRRAEGSRGRLIAAILAACWLWVGIAFHASRYATINWAAIGFAWAFAIEAALLIGMGVIRGSLRFDRQAGGVGRVGPAIFLFALAFQPLIGPLLGRGWRQVEIFGVAPDPTVVATLGILVAARCRGRWLLMVVPVFWCAVTGAALLAMKAPAFWVPPAAAALSVVAAAVQARREGRRESFAPASR